MNLDILAISAHPDDVEVAAGGTLLHHIALGKTVGLLDLTKGELGTRGNAPTRTREALQAAEILGVSVREQLDLPDGFFSIDPANLLKVIRIIRKYRPQIILTTAPDDRHPDHKRAAELCVQASFLANLAKVESFDQDIPQAPWQTRALYHFLQDKTCRADLLVDISPYIDRKFEAIKAYRSQFYDPDSTEPETPISCASFFEALRGRNAMFGRQIGVTYAEAFAVLRPPGITDLTGLH